MKKWPKEYMANITKEEQMSNKHENGMIREIKYKP